MLTDNQKICLQKAKRYAKSNYKSVYFGRYYLEFCNDKRISYQQFLNMVRGYQGIDTLPRNIEPLIPFKDYIERYNSLYLGQRLKATA